MRFLRRHGRRLVKIAGKALRKGRPADEAQRAKIERRTARLRAAVLARPRDVDRQDLDRTVRKLEKALIVGEIWKPKSFLRELAEAFVVAAIIATVVRSFIAEPFKIPTGSMIPTLQINDYIFVTKFAYGFRIPFTRTHFLELHHPDRGDVIVFDFPYPGPDEDKNFIKRVVAVPGDRVRMRNNIIHINGKPVPSKVVRTAAPCQDGRGGHTECLCDFQNEEMSGTLYQTQHISPEHQDPDCDLPDRRKALCCNVPDWPLERPEPDDPIYFGARTGSRTADPNPAWPDLVVPEGHYLVMGDNRDNSHDGRYWGLVPFEVVKGRAWIIWWATDKSRMFTAVHHSDSDGDFAHAATTRTDPATP